MYPFTKISHLAAASALAVMVVSRTAAAAPEESEERKEQASTLFDQGRKLAESDPKGALAAFRLAYELRPEPRVLYNIGKVCVRLADQPCAVQAYEQYLKDADRTELTAKRKKEIESELKVLNRGHSSTTGRTSLTIKSSITGAYVKIDGVVVGRTPFDKPVPVSAGTQIVLVTDGNVVEKSVQVAGGGSETVELEKDEAAPAPAPTAPPVVAPAPAPPAAAPPPPESPAPHAETKPKHRSVPLAPWVVTGALAAGTVVAGVLTASANSDYNAMRDDFPITRDGLAATHSKAQNLLMVTGILGAGTLISLGIASYFTFAKGRGADKTVGVAIGPAGIAITGRLF